MEKKRDTDRKRNKQRKIKREGIEKLRQKFIQVQPNHLTYSYPQDFLLENSIKNRLDVLQNQLKQPLSLRAFTHDQPTNLQQ